MNSVGIDISKGRSTIAVMRPFGEVVISPFEVRHTGSELSKLAKQLKSLDGETRVVMEATGNYHASVAKLLHNAGLYVSVINAKLVHGYGNNELRRVKTDRKDAVKLANYGLDRWLTLPRYIPEEDTRLLLKNCYRQYRQYSKVQTVLKNNLISLLDTVFPNANRLFSQNLAVLVVIGLVITGLVLVFLEPFAMLLGAKDVTLEYTKDYLRGLAPFAVCFIVSYNMEILVKTDGRPTLAIVTVITGCLTNCVLDYVAIFVLDWGAWGAAFATGLSQLLTCVMYLTHFLGKHTTFHLVRFRPDRHIYRRLLPIGVADGATELCNGLMIFLFNRTILRCIGQDGLVSYTIIAYINTLILNIMLGN